MSDHLEDSPTDMPSSNRQAARRKPGNAAGAEGKRTRRHRSGSSPAATLQPQGTAPAVAAAAAGGPCGACKFLRRRCVSGCVFAPHFGNEQGAARFAAVHKVFGASNVSKLLHRVPLPRRGDAAATICYEAQARLSDPVYGCVPTIIALQQQVASLHAELCAVQMQLLSSKMATDNAPRCSQQQQQQHAMPSRPAYSNNSHSWAPAASLPASACFAADFPCCLGTLWLWQPSSFADGDVGDDQEGGSPGIVLPTRFLLAENNNIN